LSRAAEDKGSTKAVATDLDELRKQLSAMQERLDALSNKQ
jgi:polyhydroxyalkanoate synthesis regulator protein